MDERVSTYLSPVLTMTLRQMGNDQTLQVLLKLNELYKV